MGGKRETKNDWKKGGKVGSGNKPGLKERGRREENMKKIRA